MPGFVVFTVFLALASIAVVALGLKTVPQGENWTVERFGKYTLTLKPGLNFIVPFIDAIGKKLDMREQVLEISLADAAARDNARLAVSGAVFFRITDAAKAAYEVADVRAALASLAANKLAGILGAEDARELPSRREAIAARLAQEMNQAATAWGVEIRRAELKPIVSA